MAAVSYVDAISDALHRVGTPLLRSLENSSAPTKAALGTTKRSGEVILKRVRQGENGSFGFMADGAATIGGREVGWESYDLRGKIFFGKIKINRAAATQARGQAAGTADLVMSEVKAAGEGAMRQLNHAIINGSTLALTLSGGATTAIAACTNAVDAVITDNLAFQLRVGQRLDLTDTSAAGAVVRSYFVKSRSVVIGGISTFTLTCDEAGAFAAVDGDILQFAGVADAGVTNGMTGLRDVTSSSATLFGLSSATIPNWKGVRLDAGGSLTASLFRTLKTQIRHDSGNGIAGNNFFLMNSNRLQEVYEIGDGKAAYHDTKVTIGDYTAVTTVVGDPIVVDESMLDSSVMYINKDDIKLAVFKEMFTDGDGKPGSDHGDMHFDISQTALTYESEMWGIYNLEVDARHTSGEIHSIV